MIQQTAIIAVSEWIVGLGVIVVPIVVLCVLDALLSCVHRRRHIKSRQSVSDHDFLDQIAVPPEEYQMALRCRQEIAAIMSSPAETVYPSDDFSYIARFQAVGPDFCEIEMAVEDILGVRIPQMSCEQWFGGDWETLTVTDFVHRVIEYSKELPANPDG